MNLGSTKIAAAASTKSPIPVRSERFTRAS